MDKINIVSSQPVHEMSSFGMDTRSMSSSPLVNSFVKNWLFNTAPDIDKPPFQIIQAVDLSVVDTILHDSWHLVIHPSIHVYFSGMDWDLGCLEATGCMHARKFGVSWRSSSLVHVCSAVCWCTVLLEHNVVTRHSAYCWQHCIANLFNGILWRAYAVAFFKVVQQQTIGEVGKSIMSLWALFLSAIVKELLNRTVFATVMLKWKRVQFFLTHSVYVRLYT